VSGAAPGRVYEFNPEKDRHTSNALAIGFCFANRRPKWKKYELVHLVFAFSVFAGLTAVLAKVGVEHINSNLATAIRTVVILIFAWSVALFTKSQSISTIGRRTWIFLILSALRQVYLGYVISEPYNLAKLHRSPCGQTERGYCNRVGGNLSP